MRQKIKGEKNYIKDTKSNGILNTNLAGLKAYKRAKSLAKERDKRMEKLENDIHEIKELLKGILKD